MVTIFTSGVHTGYLPCSGSWLTSSGKLSTTAAALSSQSLVPDGLFSYLNVLPRTAFEDFSSTSLPEFPQNWFTCPDICLPCAVCPEWQRARLVSVSPPSSTPTASHLIFSGTRNEASGGESEESTFDIWKIFLALSSLPFALTLCYSRGLMSHNDAWYLPNDAWALLWRGLEKKITLLV